jgi:hypothetical protein
MCKKNSNTINILVVIQFLIEKIILSVNFEVSKGQFMPI